MSGAIRKRRPLSRRARMIWMGIATAAKGVVDVFGALPGPIRLAIATLLALRLASYDLLRADGDDPILILDDVQERSLFTDMLLGLVNKSLTPPANDALRVVLLSSSPTIAPVSAR